MAGYSRHWNCRICKQPQETVDSSADLVCESCIRPLAQVLLQESFGSGTSLDTAGIDKGYWMGRARGYVTTFMRNWKAK